ncbi:T/G mismatch-specific endonuclease [Rhodopseudomonas palustris HaA2]|uniref:Very short patch repair endonuclease n=1 Tax=Rhodopseudomonas palustris (strain HaA2) TaxID=316058 RepID=Q2IUU1_RHOP2|nr:DNA mismatch endonuclease Vsr [Rhodopseudomonas palustris]ABD08019.1 T/G mismatch-specific endonuclease [Rhodopseudomonas palustris HaA2]
MGISRSENMRRIRSKDTAPEMVVRRLVHGMGYRYRLHRKDIPGKPDLALLSRKKAILVHGCFWHQHPGCREGRPPKSNREYWLPKLKRNQDRDRAALVNLADLGWRVLVVWECETKDAVVLRERLETFLEQPERVHPFAG